ncbi:hypothetical protein [Comamonas sp. JC664]|uniref:hypothetical protein n=1 Tax=Comamonas sp. JC664 TaxID=2801917 RepID=UPI00174E38EA|nr:hypothetical protein [Comamonas sp. JC664]MBL0694353.1 hypothetical protein [Comamonas sp. JC664]GHG77146.1 hypothetical protein GCM10012319_26860 [Comamonas sp. KCTC 72670]
MQEQNSARFVLCLLLAASLGCSSGATGSAGRRDTDHRDAYALASCTDTITCCLQRHPTMPDACGLSASEAAAHMATMEAATRYARDKAKAREEDDDGWKEHCMETYVSCRDDKSPRWQGDCYACFRLCEGQRQWPFHECRKRR